MSSKGCKCGCERGSNYDGCGCGGYNRCKSCCSKRKPKPEDKGFGPYSSYICVSTKGYKGKCGGCEHKCIKKCYSDKNGCKKSKCECESKYSRH